MQTFTTKTIREIALDAPETTRVFEDLKIDYCCGGRKLFADVCQEMQLDPDVVANRIAEAMANASRSEVAERPEFKSPSKLVDYIIAKHHLFTASEIERLTPLMDKVARRHGELHPELIELQSIFTDLTESLVPHMRKEENVLFPFIRMLETSLAAGRTVPVAHFGTVANPIRTMMADHDTDGDRLRRMREITADYKLPEGACPSFTALYAGLQDLERDLHRHIHLENNVLFPAAAELEQKAFATAAV